MRQVCLSAALIVASVSAASDAAVLTFNLDREFSGGTAPAGVAPWVRVIVADTATPGQVTLTVNAPTLQGSEFLTDLLLNLDPAINPSGLTFSSPSSVGSFAPPTIQLGANAVNGNAGGLFDIGISFDNSPPANRFGSGESYAVTVAGPSGLQATSFAYPSLGGGRGPLLVYAHIQGIGANGEDSGKITGQFVVPEPTTLLAGVALGLVGSRRRR